MQKGFTLIELLAVIIILAVVALIATPIVLDVVGDAKKSARDSKLELYADNVKLSATNNYLRNIGNSDGKINMQDTNNETASCTNAYYINGDVYLDDCTIDGNSGLYFMNNTIYEIKPEGFDEAVSVYNVEPPVIVSMSNRTAVCAFSVAVNATGHGQLHYRYFYKLETDSDFTEYNSCSSSECNVENVDTHFTYIVKIVVSDDYGNTTESLMEVGPYCFVAGTKVLTENGLVNIEDIKVGDMVYTLNLDNNTRELNKVTETFVNQTREIYEVTVNDKVIKTTPKHQFYAVDKGWIRAHELIAGDMLDTNGGESIITNVKYTILDEAIDVYNFTVENNHNYIITETEVLVHNVPSVSSFSC